MVRLTEKWGNPWGCYPGESGLPFLTRSARDDLFIAPIRITDTPTQRCRMAGYGTSTGTIRFSPAKPLSAAVVKKIVKLRMAENADTA